VDWFDWRIQFDAAVLDRLEELRQSKLPNETGGILLGSFDTEHKVCSIVQVVPSPKDSSEWPTSYIRGSAGLQAAVENAENSTLSQITYVGEWHSHPDNCAVLPSTDDLQAYHWLTGYMHAEGLPSIMLIIGQNNRFCIVTAEPDETAGATNKDKMNESGVLPEIS
jgi:integrative and conjugative element protein (TIGR02256 family)